ncbi:glutamate receptor 2.5-like protein isoform X1 [Cinnamomum micranthum f. kanehirae]|uniref:Glutamate receptor 2.5-like protein isoform X1 n=1 Tax=Cinnamomum micranthum f. kanehirae TaxID=337451 RepID=A0A443PKW0_9MAGN|nr:glutamate receptor 2.5-like protein isoform X1 [Cinnamomum micranthum f. kanehirae]
MVIGFIPLEKGNCRLISMLGNEKLGRSTQDLSELNVSQSFQNPRRKAEHRRSTTHVKNGNTDLKLRVLVPTKNTFYEFVKVDHDPKGNGWIVSGYSVEVFKEVMGSLPNNVSCEFIPYHNGHYLDLGHYDELIQQFQLNRYDAVVGDITITSNRSMYGDFTLPYMMPGVSMIVPVGDSHTMGFWWFLKPFTWDLWLLIIFLSWSNGCLVWFFEHENNPESKDTFLELVGKILSFSFIFVFQQWEKLQSNYSRLVVSLWIFAVFLLVTTYAGILQSMLSSDNDGATVTSLEQLIMNGDCVGYQKGSFVFDLLKNKGFQEQNLKAYSSIEEYATALSRGSHNNGVSAIIDEIPYIKVFLAKYADRYTMAVPTVNSGGFGFLFQRGAAIVPDVSRAVQKFIEGEKMLELEKKWFGTNEKNPSSPQTPQRDMRLSIHGFIGVLLITEPIIVVTLLIFIIFKKCKHGKNERSPSSERSVQTSNIEESPNSSVIEMNGGHINEGSDIVAGESDQATLNDDPPEVGVTQNER